MIGTMTHTERNSQETPRKEEIEDLKTNLNQHKGND